MHASLTYHESNKLLNQSMHILEVDPSKYEIILAKAKETGRGLESVKSMVDRYGAVAGVNGGFFKSNGTPARTLKINGQWYTGSPEIQSAVAWDANKKTFHFGLISTGFYLEHAGKQIPIDEINNTTHDKNSVLFTSAFERSSLSTPNCKEIVIKNDVVDEVREGGGQALIPENAYVVTFGKESTEMTNDIKKGDPCKIGVKYNNDDWSAFENILGGTPLLIEKGRLVENFGENIHSTFLELRHPRTALGIKKDGTWVFVLVEGRKIGQSQGITIRELAHAMLEIGCEYAINLDGGSSSTMVLQHKEIKGSFGNIPELVSNSFLVLMHK